MTLRYITLSDVDALERLDRKCFPPPVRYNRYALDYYLSLPNTFGLAEFIADDLIGFIIVTTTPKNSANIVTIDVDPDIRRRGIGSNLLMKVKNILMTLNINRITLQVSMDNEPAVKFYKKFGFSIVKTLPMYYPTTDGYQMELIMG